MENKLVPIKINKEGVSDTFYTINELYMQNGAQVTEGDLIFCFETSKTTVDVEATSSGYIFYNIKENDDIAIGQIAAIISLQKDVDYQSWFLNNTNTPKTFKKDNNVNIKISKPAQKLMDDNNIDSSVFVGKSLITTEDVKQYLSQLLKNNDTDDLPELNNTSVVIFGGGGHAKMCIDIVRQEGLYNIVGILDDNLSNNTKVFSIPVLGDKTVLETLINNGLKNIILGVGGVLSKGLREQLFAMLKQKQLHIPTIIHPSASLEPSVIYGEGNQIMQGAIVGSNVTIGRNCIINSGSIISHDTNIGDNVHIAPGAIIGGGVTIKDNTIIGMGCTIFLGITIGKNVIIKNGLHIFSNIQDGKNVKENIG